jgi:2,3-dihydroxyphenylpropionate 1,2-dioxygenase
MGVAALFASHSPLQDYHEPASDVLADVNGALSAMSRWARGFDPDVVLVIGPDHYNSFFYRLMPSFCIGTAVESIGDWNTPAGKLPVAADRAEQCVQYLHCAGVDVALSHQMEVDHGSTQFLNQIFDWDAMPPIVPIFINCAAPPLPPLNRIVALGTALGEFVNTLSGRILIMASGGLSHDPPIPNLTNASPAVRERLIVGGTLAPDARAARQKRVLDDASAQAAGTSDQRPLNPEWDRKFLDDLEAFDFESIRSMSDDSITADAGCGGHEIRTWIATAAAAQACGINSLERIYYRAIPEWIAGYGLMKGVNL